MRPIENNIRMGLGEENWKDGMMEEWGKRGRPLYEAGQGL
jgi:hypothetical protein